MAEQDIKKLRKFVEAGLSKEVAERVDSTIVLSGLHSFAIVHVHRPELENGKSPPVFTHTLLKIKDGAARLNRLKYVGEYHKEGQNANNHR